MRSPLRLIIWRCFTNTELVIRNDFQSLRVTKIPIEDTHVSQLVALK